MCQAAAHRSTEAQPVPAALVVLLLPVVSQPAALEWVGEGNTPGTDQPPAHAAMFGKVVWLRNASRVPSAQPTGETVDTAVHTPPAQICDPVQVWPQPPQLLLSLPVVTHDPLHNTDPLGQD